MSTSSNEIMPGKSHESWPSNLIIRAASLPPRRETKDQNPEGIDPGRRLLTNTEISMQISQKIDEIQDEESEFSMGKLIRQASLSNSDSFPPRTPAATKSMSAANSSLSRHESIRKIEQGRLIGSDKIIRPQRVRNQLKTQKSLNDMELYRELQAIKDLGLDPWSGNVRTIDKKSTEDIKAKIKFWARAVASNVRPENYC